MNRLTRICQRLLLAGLLLLAGCSTQPAGEGLREIQGVWRHSDQVGANWRHSVTFEFSGNQFRTYGGAPAFLARGSYQVERQGKNSYQLKLRVQEKSNFDAKTLLVSPADKGLLIENRLFRRILRQ